MTPLEFIILFLVFLYTILVFIPQYIKYTAKVSQMEDKLSINVDKRRKMATK
jgi:hypothetical protein